MLQYTWVLPKEKSLESGRRLTLLKKGGGTFMTMEYITIVGFALTVFVAGVAVGKFVERIERFIHKNDDEEHKKAHKNNRR